MTEKNEKKKLNDEEFLRALEDMEALEETIGMTDEQIEAEIRARGGIRRRWGGGRWSW